MGSEGVKSNVGEWRSSATSEPWLEVAVAESPGSVSGTSSCRSFARHGGVTSGNELSRAVTSGHGW